ncbi:MAG: hypothetical protein FRX48_02732 [Lasallia pustulata]|uniref:Uncharacterized protein n=1 Tax=Lasallia pustulata TaxID=136370 RepID=A0A1W5DDN3_9LECA|nr:MAG: hypothetical protein FRX48_02732 [Lasallia pustulata]SLM41115.1 hypothetical protein LPUS_12034 [Lasallia pustulata]
MSGSGEERWRTARGTNSPSSQNQSQNRQQPGPQPRSDPSSNAWVPNERGNRDGTQSGPPQDQHTPVRGFKAKDALKKGYSSLTPEEARSTSYKYTGGQANSATSGGPWASKPNTMVNGKDF